MTNNDYIEFEDGTRLYRIDTRDEWENSAYDEDGDSVECELCGGEFRWNGSLYVCKDCRHEMSRSDFLDYIGADLPDQQCLRCKTNYPFCKKSCKHIVISPDDPMLR